MDASILAQAHAAGSGGSVGWHPVSLASLQARAGERRLALAAGIVLALAFIALAPFARTQLARIDAFIPVYQSILAISELITAILLFGQFAYSRSRALLVLAGGYLFAALMAAIHMLTFPGLFAPTGLLGAGPQSTAWLYMFWHGGFPLAVIAYAWLARSEGDRPPMPGPALFPIIAVSAAVAVAVAAMALLATAGQGSLPGIMQGNNYTPAMIVVVSSVWGLSLLALFALWRQGRRSVLDLWLLVVMGAWLGDVALSAVLNAGRFDLGFYAGRIYGLLAASFVLFVLLYETVGLYGVACGVIDQRTAELTRAHAKLEAMIDSSPLAIIALDRQHRVITWGRAAEKIFGYSKDDVLGLPYPLVPEGGQEEFERFFSRIVDHGELVADIAVRRQRKNGELRDIVFSGAPLRDDRGWISGAVYALEDVTEKKKVEQKLIQSQKMEAVGQLTGGLAHDFNNLLGVVIGNLDLIQEELPKDHPAQPLIQTAIEASLRGSHLNKSLLAFSRRQELRPERVEIGAVVETLSKMLRRLIGERIELEAIAADGLWPVVVDVSQLEAALLNLSVNARDAMPNGGRLVIEAANGVLDEADAAENADATPGDHVIVAVSDTGTGMTPDILAKVFEPFFTTKEVGKGTGLGLSMVHGFIKQSRGHVKIYSEPGRGTTIRLYLPRDRSAPAAIVPEAEVEEVKQTGTETILVVEDNEPLRRTASAKLAKLGYRVIEAANAAEALQIIDGSDRPHLLFSDVVMPGKLDGIGLAAAAVQRQPDLKVLLTSGFTERSGVATEGRRLAWPLLSKPYRIAELARALRKALDQPVRRAS